MNEPLHIEPLLASYLSGDASSLDRSTVEQWIAESPENRKVFDEFRTIWRATDLPAFISKRSEDQAWSEFQRRVGVKPLEQTSRPGSGRILMRVAAAVVFLVGIGAALYFLTPLGQENAREMAVVTTDDILADTLPDGSVATLNKHSVLNYPSIFSGKERQVNLKGEAFFSVKPDKDKPFIIDVNDVKIRVLGTSFNVRTDERGTEVIVETGIVQVSSNGVITELHAGERSLVRADSVGQTQTSGDELYKYYRSRSFICDNTPLWKLVEKLNEAYDVRIVVGSASLKKMPLNVTFDQESLDTILRIISETLLVKTRRSGDQIEIYR